MEFCVARNRLNHVLEKLDSRLPLAFCMCETACWYVSRGDCAAVLLHSKNAQRRIALRSLSPDFHFSFGCANHRVVSDAFIYAG